MNSLTPFSIFPYFITSRTYSVGAALIRYSNMLFNFQLLEKVFVPFLDGFPTVDRTCIGHKKPVFRKEGGNGSCVAVPRGFAKSQSKRENLLSCLRINRIFLLGDRKSVV